MNIQQKNKDFNYNFINILITIILGLLTIIVNILLDKPDFLYPENKANELIALFMISSIIIVILLTYWLFLYIVKGQYKYVLSVIFCLIIFWIFSSIVIDKKIEPILINNQDSLSILPIVLNKDTNLSYKILLNPEFGHQGYGLPGITFFFNEDGIDITKYKKILLDLEIPEDLGAELDIKDIWKNSLPHNVKLKKGKNQLLVSKFSQNSVNLTNIESIRITNRNLKYKPHDLLNMKVKQLKFIK